MLMEQVLHLTNFSSVSPHRIAIGKNAQFRKFCNSFFLDLVSTMCFKDNEPPEKAVIQELLKLLFVQKEILRGMLKRYWLLPQLQ